MKNKCLLKAVLSVLLISPSVFALDIYVAPHGDDNNDGTIGAPFATVTKARDTIRGMRTGSLGVNGATEITMAGWVNADSKDSNDGIITCSGNTYFGLLFSGAGAGNPLECRAMGTSLRAPDNTVPAGSWYHVAGVWKSGQIHKLYINGVEVANNTNPKTGVVDANQWFLGSDRLNDGRYLDGSTRDFYVWDRALSASEITSLASATPTVPSDYALSETAETSFDNLRAVELEQIIPPLPEEVNVWFRGGRYPITSTVEMELQDSGSAGQPVTYGAYPGEDVIFDNGLDVGGSGFVATTDNKLQPRAHGNVYVKTITDPMLIDKLEDQYAMLVVDDRVMIRARFPNFGFDTLSKIADDVEIGATGTAENPLGPVVKMDMTINGYYWRKEIERIQKAKVSGYISADWKKEINPIVSVNSDNHLTLMHGTSYGFGGPSHVERAYVEDLLCELDEPGEWYFDDIDDKLYLWPRNPIDSDTSISLCAGPRVFDFSGTQYVNIENITMQNAGSSSGEFVSMVACDHVKVAGCTFRNCSPVTIAIRISAPTMNSGLVSCDFYDINNATALGGQKSSNSSIIHSQNYIKNCHFTQVWSKSLYGKVSGISGAGNEFSNNLLHNHNGQVVTIGGQDHLIELNEVFNSGVEEGDGGTFYQGASFTSWGNLFKNNFWHHIMCIPKLYRRAAMFSDDGDLGETVSGNVFYKVGDGFKSNIGAGHSGSGNVFLDSVSGIHIINGNPSGMYTENVGYLDSDPLTGEKSAQLARALPTIGVDSYLDTISSQNWNSHISSFWRSRYPRLDALFDSWWAEKQMKKYCDFDSNVFYSNDSNTLIPAEVSVTGSQQLSDLNDFENPSVLDFKFKSPAPGWAPVIPFENIGLYADEYRTSVPNKAHYRKAVKDRWKGHVSDGGSIYEVSAVNDRQYFNTGKMLYGFPLEWPSVVDVSTTKYDYDFGPVGSATESGWTRISPETNGDIHWDSKPNSVDRGSGGGINNINRDMVYHTQPRTLEHKIENGRWEVKLNMGDKSYIRDDMVVKAEGIVQNANVDSGIGDFTEVSFEIEVEDGSLSLEFSDGGGADAYWVLNRMTLTKVRTDPMAPYWTLDGPFQFDGASDYLTLSDPTAANTATEMTMVVIVTPDTKGDFEGIISCTGNYFGLLTSGYGVGNPIEFRAMGNYILSPDNTCPVGTATHIAAVWKSGEIQKLYLDGVEVASNPTPPSGTLDVEDWFVGRDRTYTDRYFDGRIEGLKIWARALSASEILDLYNTDTSPPTPNPAGFSSAPAATGASAITMTATTGVDDSGPVEYLFTETSGNPGGTSSSWQTSPSYTDTGLNPVTEYTYTVTMRDSEGNTGSTSSPFSATTDIDPQYPVWTHDGPTSFNGSSDYLMLNNPTVGNGATELTIVARVTPDSKGSFDGIITSSGDYFGLLISGYGTGNPVEFRAMNSYILSPANTCPVGTTTHIAAVWKSGEIQKLYLNGEEVASDATPPAGTMSISDWTVGRDRTSTSRYYDGEIEGLKIWTRALTAAEIAALASDLDDDGLPDEWENQYFVYGTDAGPLDDPDGDLLPNFAEYAFGGNPNVADAAAREPKLDISGSSPRYVFDLRNDGGLSAIMLVKTNLLQQAWETNMVRAGVSGEGSTTYTNSLPEEDCLFVRWLLEK